VRTPSVFLAYAPRGQGLRCAVAYLSSERAAYGWFVGPRDDSGVASCFFLLEEFYTNRLTRYEAVDHSELHGAWLLDDERRHELAQMQEAFGHEWLFYRDDPRGAAELQAYAEAELAVGEVNIRFARLAKFSRAQPTWTYYSQRFERRVLNYLAKRWPLEYRMDLKRVARSARVRVARSRARPR